MTSMRPSCGEVAQMPDITHSVVDNGRFSSRHDFPSGIGFKFFYRDTT